MKERMHNIDLLRTIAAFLVIYVHVNLMFLFVFSIASAKGVFVWLGEFVSLICVNLYALISGMVGYKREFKWKRLIIVFVALLFYNAVAQGINIYQNQSLITTKEIIKFVTPITNQNFWYVNCYIGLCFFIPILNKGIEMMNKKTYYIFCFASFILFCVLSYFKDVFLINGGSSVIWLMIMYVVGAGLIKFDVKNKLKMSVLVIMFFSFAIINYVLFRGIHYFKELEMPSLQEDFVYLHHNLPFTFLTAISFVLILLNINYFDVNKNNKVVIVINKITAFIAPLTLGIYMAHTSMVQLFQIITKINIIESLKEKNVGVLAVSIFMITLVLFIVSAFVEKGRKKIEEKLTNFLQNLRKSYN